MLAILRLLFIRNLHGSLLTRAAVKGTEVVWTVVIVITAAQFAVTYLAPKAGGSLHGSRIIEHGC